MKKHTIFLAAFFLMFNIALASSFYTKQEVAINDLDSPILTQEYMNASVDVKNNSRPNENTVILKNNIKLPEISTFKKAQSAKEANTKEPQDKVQFMQDRLEHTLGSLTSIIKNYAETEGLEESSQLLFEQLGTYSKELNEEVQTYPQHFNVEPVNISPKVEFNKTQKAGPPMIDSSSMEELYVNLYKQLLSTASAEKLLENNNLMKMPPLPEEKRFAYIKEHKRVVMKNGIVTEDIFYREQEEIKEIKAELLPGEKAEEVFKIY